MARIKIESQAKEKGERVVINFKEEDYVAFKLNNGKTKAVHKHLAKYLSENGKGEILPKVKISKETKGTAKVLDVD